MGSKLDLADHETWMISRHSQTPDVITFTALAKELHMAPRTLKRWTDQMGVQFVYITPRRIFFPREHVPLLIERIYWSGVSRNLLKLRDVARHYGLDPDTANWVNVCGHWRLRGRRR